MSKPSDRQLASRVTEATRALVDLAHSPLLGQIPDCILRHGTVADEYPKAASFSSYGSGQMSDPTAVAATAKVLDRTPLEVARAAEMLIAAHDRLVQAVIAMMKVTNPWSTVPGYRGEPGVCNVCGTKPVRYPSGVSQMCETHEKAWYRLGKPVAEDGAPNVTMVRTECRVKHRGDQYTDTPTVGGAQ